MKATDLPQTIGDGDDFGIATVNSQLFYAGASNDGLGCATMLPARGFTLDSENRATLLIILIGTQTAIDLLTVTATAVNTDAC